MGPEERESTISTTSGSRSPGNMSREVTFPCKAISLAVADLSQGIPAATIVRETQYLRSQNLILLSKCALMMPPLHSRQREEWSEWRRYIIDQGSKFPPICCRFAKIACPTSSKVSTIIG